MSASKVQPDERVVFMALRDVFVGPLQSHMRKKVAKRIKDHIAKDEIRPLVEEYGNEQVTNIAHNLVLKGVFQSNLVAKIHLPDLFDVSPAQTAERVALERESIRSDESVIKEVSEICRPVPGQHIPGPDAGVNNDKAKGKQPAIPIDEKASNQVTCTCSTAVVPSLYPVYLPFESQHHVLSKVQAMLESACYIFMYHNMPDKLRSKEWDCAEALELNVVAHSFQNYKPIFNSERVAQLNKKFPEFLEFIAQLRHTAVHRLRISANTVEQSLLDAESFANLPDDENCVRSISRIRQQTQLAIDEISRNKDLLELQLTRKMKDIAARRAELESLEKKAIEEMLQQDKDYQQTQGASLRRILKHPDKPSTIGTVSTNEASSDDDSETLAGLDLEDNGEGPSSASSACTPI